VQNDILVAAGTGVDPHFFLGYTLDVPFGNALYVVGDTIRHNANSAEFTILTPGQYQIDYQLSAYNPVLDTHFPIDDTVTLVSNLQGILDSFHITQQFQLVQRSITVNLAVAEILVLRVTQAELSELSVNSQAIVIAKIA